MPNDQTIRRMNLKRLIRLKFIQIKGEIYYIACIISIMKHGEITFFVNYIDKEPKFDSPKHLI